MHTVRRSNDRGFADHGWLRTYHTFSFAGYYDPAHMGFRSLRVLNDDRVAPSAGFPTHPHRDMEIVSYVVEGALEHRDDMGNGSVIRPGDVQRMSAGTGVLHSEFNPSQDEGARFLQVWILPRQPGGEPGYEQRNFGSERNGRLRLVASPDGRDGSLTVRQDAAMFAAVLDAGEEVRRDLEPGRHAWLQVVRGRLESAGHDLSEGDGLAVSAERSVRVRALEPAELLLFDLA